MDPNEPEDDMTPDTPAIPQGSPYEVLLGDEEIGNDEQTE